ncbi:MAG: PLP-dependent aminotransferase family protein [Kangiellaceae bacterium]|nr:PLP-dependent aminotransferase family protein [Kangiellaceae bacterium]
MKELTIILEPTIKPVYLRIASAIRAAISNGQLKPNENLPSARRLAEQFEVNRHTVMAALQELIAQGWLESAERKGYQVAKFLPVEQSLDQSTKLAAQKSFIWKINNQLSFNASCKPAHEHRYNFSGGMPDISLFPFKEFKQCLSQSLARPKIEDFTYGKKEGTTDFLEQVGLYLRRVRSITNKKLIAVNGTQEALYLISQVLLKPGDCVAVESLGYRPAWQAFRTTGAKLVAMQQNSEGIDVQHLEKLISGRTVKLIYLTPLHQYPTTITLPLDKRMQIYALAAKYNVAIVEDDYDHEFHFNSQPLAPMAADDPQGLVIYLASFSKIMFPGCRIGCMAVDESLFTAMINYRSVINHKSNPLIQEAIAYWMKEGGFERHLRKMTKLYQRRRDFLIQQLKEYQNKGFELNYHIPAGGMAIWLDVGRSAKALEEFATTQGIFLQTEHQFHLEQENNQDRFIRLGFAGMSSEMLTEGLRIIFDFIRKR